MDGVLPGHMDGGHMDIRWGFAGWGFSRAHGWGLARVNGRGFAWAHHDMDGVLPGHTDNIMEGYRIAGIFRGVYI